MGKNTYAVVVMLVFISLIVSLVPLETYSQTEQTKTSTVQSTNKSVDFVQEGVWDPDKFDPDFYALVQKLTTQTQDENILKYDAATQSERETQKPTTRTQDENLQSLTYHDVIITVNKYDQDGTNYSEANKDAVVKILKEVGARDIKVADLLSFVTAQVPINRILEISGHGQVYRMGDGQAQITPTIDKMRMTIRATPDDLRRLDGTIVNGSGVVVGVVDTGINHPKGINDSVIDRVLCTEHGCSPSLASSVTPRNIVNQVVSHGTQVAMVIAGSGFVDNSGIAPGVDILDAGVGRHSSGGSHGITLAKISHAVEWLLEKDADASNMSLGYGYCDEVNFNTTPQLLTGEAADLGMLVVVAAGNRGSMYSDYNTIPVYKSVTELACPHNIITVGGIDDRDPDNVSMYTSSSRGPASHDIDGTIYPILKPEVVAPAYQVDIPSYLTSNSTRSPSGTSLSAPAVTAVVAMALQERDMEPATVKAAVLLGANWMGPVPCTSVQYEESNPTDNCSHARQPTDFNIANNADSLGIINNVGFGILDAGKTIDYVTGASGRHIVESNLYSNSDADAYQFEVHDTENMVKVILSWTINPFYERSSGDYFADLGFTVDCPGMDTISAQSAYQSNEFAVFVPAETGTCTVKVTGTDVDTPRRSEQNYALASTLPLSSSDDTFVMVWNTTVQGESIIIPVDGAVGTYSVEWGDGTVSDNVNGDQTHAYGSAGTHTVSISGDFTRINLGDDANNAAKLHSIVRWGDYQWQSMESAFKGASNMTYSAMDLPNLSDVTSTSSMFSGASSFNSDISDWDVSSVTDMSGMFSGASSFNSDISDWDVSSVTDMSGMFSGADSFAQNLGTWYIVLDDTSARTGNAAIAVGSIEAQNTYLDGQNPSYGIGIGGDSGYFETDGSTLVLNAGSDLPENHTYAVNITSTGSFGTNNTRMAEVVINNPPVVDAGVNQEIEEGSIVNLSGTASDADQWDSLTYEWSHDGYMPIMFDNSSSPSTWFEVRHVISNSTVTLTLTVSDGITSSDDTVEITILDTVGVPFVTTWQTTSANEAIAITVNGASNTYTDTLVDWGDGTISTNKHYEQIDMMHIYDHAGTYTVSMSGNFTRINLVDENNARKLQSIEQWGDIKWESMSRVFYKAVNMIYNASDTPDLASVTDMSGMFSGASSFNSDISDWDVSNVDKMYEMFAGASSFNSDISDWDVSNVDKMHNMFAGASSFNSDISDWDVSSVTDMSYMFSGASSFNSDISDWDVSNVDKMYEMFAGASSFNSYISDWDVSNVGNMYKMFSGASSFNSDISDWDVSNVDNMYSMFAGASSFNSDISDWDVSNVDNMYNMFAGASSFNSDISDWDVSNVDKMYNMFAGASSFNSDISDWDVSNVGYMYRMFSGASSFNSDISDWDVSSATDMSYMFPGASSFNSDISDWDVSNVDNMYSMFAGASSFNSDISDWDVSSVTNTSYMFSGASSFNSDISDWDVSNVDNMYSMFAGASSFNSDISDWDVSNGDNMYNMFAGASSFNSDISDWDVSNVDKMHNMFSGASSFNSDISDWDVSNVDYMYRMFSGASSFNSDISDWDVSSVTNTSYMFSGASSFNSDISDWDVSNVDNMSGMFADALTFRQNLGNWYVVLNNTTIHVDNTPGVVGHMSAQNLALDYQNSTYNIGDGKDSDSFNITDSSVLNMIVSPDKPNYTVNITSTGDFGTSNYRIYSVTVADIDTASPTVTSIERHDPISESTDSQTLVYRVTFSKNVIGVNADDFVLSQNSTGAGSITGITGSGDIYNVTVSAAQDGTYNLDLVSSGHDIEDLADNPLTNTATTGVDQTYMVNTVPADSTAPTLTSIERFNPIAETTDSQTLVYEVTFSEDVTGVDLTDFALSSGSIGSTGTGTGTGQFTQTRSPDIDITADNTITDTITVTDSGDATSVSLAVDITHTYRGDLKVDLIAPDGTTKTVHSPSSDSADNIDQTYTPDFAGVSIAGIWTLRVSDNYAAYDDGTLNSWTLTINHGSGGNTTNPVTTLTGSGSTYYATVSATQDGAYNLDLISSGHGIEDTADNPLTNTSTTGADETYTVSTVVTDTTAPRLSSIERSNPSSMTTSSQTLIYEVTFSEDVTGVDSTDFALSSGSIGSTDTGTGTGQFTQTRSPDIDITADNTITDTITVTDSGDATSVSLAVDITHTYRGDLRVDLIAPDGTTKTVHSPSSDSADNIDQTYTPDFAGVSIAGIWTLRVSDNYAAYDDGTLNSWTLTINHGSGGNTTNPVTTLSGSGSTYYATVSATQDGAYNLDLISSGHGIEDTADNPLTNTSTTGADETYTVSTVVTDTTAPRLSSIERSNPSSMTTSSQTLIYEVTFSEDVTGVDSTDFALSSGSIGSTDTGTGTGQFTQTRSPDIDITADNTITDTITVTDSGDATSVSLAVDITHTYRGDLRVDLIAPDGTTKTVHSPSSDSADNIDQTYTPDFAGVSIAGIWTLRVSDNYAAYDDGTLNSWTLTINHGSGGNTTNPVTTLSGSGSTYYATVSATQDGAYNLDLISSGHGIEDTADNPLTNTSTTGADETYTVSTVVTDTTAPRLSSIERSNPSSMTTSSQTLIYEVTFSEDVTGVDSTDFALSSGSIGSTDTGTGTGQFTQTRSPDIDITADNTITDTITVTDSGDATSVSLAVDITHTYRGDLRVDLIAPDGTTKTVHSPSSDSADNIDQTYTPDFAGVSIAGIWTLRVSDNYAAYDDGTLNSWTLTINHGSGGNTTNPVTTLSGSGSTYYATVSATQDGAYNLDLISSGHGIEDTADNPLTNTSTTGADETYTVSTVVTDTTAPRLSSIERSNPSSMTTSSQTLIYEVTFSEDVTGVDSTDFALSSGSIGSTDTGTGTGQFTQTRSPDIDITADNTITDTITVTDSGDATSVSLAVDITHTYRGDLRVDLIAPDGTTKTVHSPSSDSADNIDQTYTPDFAGVSIAGIWTLRVSDNYAAYDDGTLNSWTLTINHGSGGNTTNPVTTLSGSGSTYYATVSATQDGAYNLDLISSGHGIEDTADNPLTNTSTTGADETYTVSTVVTDTTAPRLSSIERSNPSSMTTSSQTLIYEVTFSEDVTGVDSTDFALSSGSIGSTDTGTGTGQFTQTRSPDIDITADNTITDTITVTDSGDATSVSLAVDITHTYRGDLRVDLIAPDGTTKTVHSPSSDSADNIDQTYTPDFAGVSIAGIWTLRVSDNYAAYDDGTLNSWTLTINHGSGGNTTNPVTNLSGSGSTYYATVSATQDGAYNLDLISSGHGIEDTADNPLTNTSTTGADETYTVSTVVTDTTAPRLSSIERSNPSSMTTSSQTLIYEVTFSEDVTGVDSTDFALSSGSIGSTDTGTGTGQFTQTRSPDIDITADNTITDTITVTDSGDATSVSLAVDITHTYRGDLKVDLIAPDGTTKTVHSPSSDSADNIDQTYTPDFAGVSIAGIWTLRVSDNYAAYDDGTLNSWTLTINHGSGSTTNPVTNLSGSGSTYYATVSATQDGAYNLDLISSGHGIEDTADNPLTNTSTTGADETYTVSTVVTDTTAPRLSSIERSNPSSMTTSSQTLIYEVTFSEDVTGVDSTDFALSSGSIGSTDTGTGTGQFTQTRSPDIDITADNTITDTITVTDSGDATSVSLAVDITHTYRGDLKVDLIAPDGTTKTVHSPSSDSADNIDQTYTPDFAGVSIAGIWTLRVSDNYAAYDDGTLNSWTLTINHGSGSTTNPVTNLSGSGSTYYATVSATQDGAYNLDLISSGHGIEDTADNPLTNTSTTGADETYTVSTVVTDTTAPRLSSIERSNPSSMTTSSQTLIYEVTFSEDVTGVDTDDFVLSTNSTGGGGNNNNTNTVSSEQFTHTRSPSSPIIDNYETSDTITVPDSGTATSVSVAVNISHTYIGDLKVDLIAPDGTVRTLHNRSGGIDNDIVKTYTPNLDDIQVQGAWKLKINDNESGDTGTLNSWTLVVNYDIVTTIPQVNPVTGISGSGDAYYVTVSASTDGTYNLDLVSSGHDIEDLADNPLTNTATTGVDQTYMVNTVPADSTAPTHIN